VVLRVALRILPRDTLERKGAPSAVFAVSGFDAVKSRLPGERSRHGPEKARPGRDPGW
jgi:hypothetical protein